MVEYLELGTAIEGPETLIRIPIDVLLIINALNARQQAEGEQTVAVSSDAIDQAFALEVGEENDLTFRKRRSRR